MFNDETVSISGVFIDKACLEISIGGTVWLLSFIYWLFNFSGRACEFTHYTDHSFFKLVNGEIFFKSFFPGHPHVLA
jgi:hypothetical protein